MMARILLAAALGLILVAAVATWRSARAAGGWEVTLLWPGAAYDAVGRGHQRLGREVYGTRAECEGVADRVRPWLPKVRLRCDPKTP